MRTEKPVRLQVKLNGTPTYVYRVDQVDASLEELERLGAFETAATTRIEDLTAELAHVKERMALLMAKQDRVRHLVHTLEKALKKLI